MEFWGVEVKSGQPFKVDFEDGKLLHLSHATIGESKGDKGKETVPLFVKFNGQKLVLGNLSHDNAPQLSFDLVFEKEFELSHNSKHGSVYFMGYKSALGEEEEDSEDSESDYDSDVQLHLDNGKVETKVEPVKPSKAKDDSKPESSGKPKVKVEEPPKNDDEDDSSDDEDDSDEDGDEEMADGDDSSDDSDDAEDDEDNEDDEEDEETPKKAEPSKKRAAEIKTPVPTKKAKFATPQKTDAKKETHTATPHPSKKEGKTPAADKASGNKSAQNQKSAGKVSCSSCSKTFNSDAALQSHTKAKHSAK